MKLTLGDMSIDEIIDNFNFKYMLLKIPLNEEHSPYSNDYKPLKY